MSLSRGYSVFGGEFNFLVLGCFALSLTARVVG